MLKRFLKTQLRFLAFKDAPISAGERGIFLVFALVITWLAGIGRYWDHPDAHVWQYAGLGSVAYVFVLAGVLWLVGKPLRPRGWGYLNVLLFVCLTSLPALLYAIPVERFTSFSVASGLNVWFLAIVAALRVALLMRHLIVTSALGVGIGIVVALLPLTVIVTALAVLNLEHATFEVMAGMREEGDTEGLTTNDGAYGAVFLLSIASFFLVVPLLIAYGAAIVSRRSLLGEIERGSNSVEPPCI